MAQVGGDKGHVYMQSVAFDEPLCYAVDYLSLLGRWNMAWRRDVA